MKNTLRSVLLCLLTICAPTASRADPWLGPGDEGLRSDVQLLADAGILRGPVTTWPLSWPDIARDTLGASVAGLDEATADALLRVKRLSRAASDHGFTGIGIRTSGSNEPTSLRTFAHSPREEAELAFRASWLTDHVSLNLQGAAVVDPDDGKQFRADGSYLGVNFGNFMVSAGFMERWWGPGWDGSLILSTNARPIPSLTLERNYTDPFRSKLLSWIGPWRASIAMGRLETHDVAVPDVRFLAARVNFKPRPWLEIGLTRTAQWCGGERACDWDTFLNMLLGRDNQVEDGTGSVADQPGNQMAGYDARIRSPWKKLPVAVYMQWIGEDEAGGLPSKFLGQFGIESWFSTKLGGLRVRAEFADTTCSFTLAEPEYNCAYRNEIYPQAYSYRRRIIGHSMDNDSRTLAVAALLVRPNGDALSLTVRRFELNRDGTGTHAIALTPEEFDNVELRYSRQFSLGKVSLGLGLDNNDGSGFISWQQGF